MSEAAKRPMPVYKSVQKNRKNILGGREKVKVAIVQYSNPYLNRDGTIEIACKAIREAGAQGAEFIVFPENYIAGYPYWTQGWNTDMNKARQGFVLWHDAAIMIGTEDTERLGAAARDAGAYVAVGCNEMDPRPESDTIFSSILYFNPDGSILGVHRRRCRQRRRRHSGASATRATRACSKRTSETSAD
jgi:nitrilase